MDSIARFGLDFFVNLLYLGSWFTTYNGRENADSQLGLSERTLIFHQNWFNESANYERECWFTISCVWENADSQLGPLERTLIFHQNWFNESANYERECWFTSNCVWENADSQLGLSERTLIFHQNGFNESANKNIYIYIFFLYQIFFSSNYERECWFTSSCVWENADSQLGLSERTLIIRQH